MKSILKIFILILLFANIKLPVNAKMVVFNPNTLKVHKQSCQYVNVCKCCIKIERSEAYRRGGIPCKKCGG